ncbi:MAG: IS3 family transposase [Gammaproteobacteria bacterium]|nr:IS3 family transposase [Gammaproteobacteria bacterium]
MRYRFIQQQQHQHRIAHLCQAMNVSRCGYYAWIARAPSAREQANNALLEKIKVIHQQHRSTCGSDKTWRLLKQQGETCGRHQVARLRRTHGIEAIRMKRFKASRGARNNEPVSDNVLNRQFTTSQPDQAWVTDTTFIPTRQGWLYLATVMDLYSRKVVGWAMGNSNNKQLVCNALTMAIQHRQPKPGLLHHSDQGITYTSAQYRELLKQHKMIASMSRKGNCHDNAVAESFFANLKNELIYHRDFTTREEARCAIFDYIELFYNRKRLHQTLNYQTPEEYETMQAAA